MKKRIVPPVLVLGTVAVDAIETPSGRRKESLGGSAVYASFSASFFAPVRLVAAVGPDFPSRFRRVLSDRGMDLDGLEIMPHEKTFRWEGRYGLDLNEAVTVATHLNVLARFKPRIPKTYRSTPYLFLANIDPDLQENVLNTVKAKWVVLDSMNFWITHKRRRLLKSARRADVVVLNDAEARQFSGESNLIAAARSLRRAGLKRLIIKKGEHGAFLFDRHGTFAVPAYPQPNTVDPTGCGDTFAGGFIGHLARSGRTDHSALRQAVVTGSVMASFTVEDFSLNRLRSLKSVEITRRLHAIRRLVHF